MARENNLVEWGQQESSGEDTGNTKAHRDREAQCLCCMPEETGGDQRPVFPAQMCKMRMKAAGSLKTVVSVQV